MVAATALAIRGAWAIADDPAAASSLAHAIPSFPTRSETWLKLLEAYGV